MKDITALILTYNEKENIERTLRSLAWVDQILLIDSFSDDGTVEIARQVRMDVTVEQRRFDSFAAQCNFGLGLVLTAWVLSLDADYTLSDELQREIEALAGDAAGYSAPFRYCVNGRPLRKSILPPRTILYRKECAFYHNEGHGHRVKVQGEVRRLSGFILHDDRKPLSRWLRSQDHYMRVEAPHLLSTPNEQLNLPDRLRKRIFFAPPIIFLYLLFVHGLIFDGWPGWYYVLQRTIAEALLSLRLLTCQKCMEGHCISPNETPSR